MDQVFKKIARLNDIGIALSAASDVDILCDEILSGAMELTNCDGGSLYMMSDDKTSLEFIIVWTHSLGIHMGGGSGVEITLPPVPITSLILSGLIFIVKILGAYGARLSLGLVSTSAILPRIWSLPFLACSRAFAIMSLVTPLILTSI